MVPPSHAHVQKKSEMKSKHVAALATPVPTSQSIGSNKTGETWCERHCADVYAISYSVCCNARMSKVTRFATAAVVVLVTAMAMKRLRTALGLSTGECCISICDPNTRGVVLNSYLLC